MNKQPFFILVVCFILGIFFQDEFLLSSNIIFVAVIVCLLFFLVSFFNFHKFLKLKPILLGFAFFGLGVVLHSLHNRESIEILSSKNEEVVFKIDKKLNSNLKYKKYEVAAEINHQQFNAILYIPKNHQELDFENFYKVKAYLSKPKSPENNFQFNFAKYLQRKDIDYQIFVNDKISVSAKPKLTFWDYILQKRLEVLQKINQSSLSPKSQEFLKGIILADRTEIDATTVQDFNRSGLVHFLAISGTHIVVIFGLFYFLLTKFSPLKFRKFAIIISLLFIWIFALFIGFGNSVVRSCIMLTIYFIYVLLQRKPDLLHSLALSAFVILVIDSQQIFDVGFQLSFLAVLGIFWLNQPILKLLPKQNKYWKKVVFNTISISISAQLATLPLVLYYFHQFSFISIIANFFIVPFSEIVIILSFLMTGFMAFNIDFQVFNIVYDAIISFLLKIIHWFASWDIFYFENLSMSLLEVFSLFVIIYYLRFFIKKYNFFNFYKLAICILIFFFIKFSTGIYYDQKEEFLIHHHKKDLIISLKKGNEVCFWLPNDANFADIENFLIKPYQVSRRIKVVEIKRLPKNANQVVFNKKKYDLE